MRISIWISCFTIIMVTGLPNCNRRDHSSDTGDKEKRIALSPDDLQHFKALEDAILHDSIQIRELEDRGMVSTYHPTWRSTNPYYLYQIDYQKYHALLSPLEGKWKQELYFSTTGRVQLILHQEVNIHTDTYNDTYTGILTDRTVTRADLLSYGDIQRIIQDTILDSRWRYFYIHSHTGH